MKSCLYRCSIFHDRKRPKKHSFKYHFFYFGIDLDELNQLTKNPLVGLKNSSVYSIRKTDHLNFGQSSIKGNVIEYLRQNDVKTPVGRILLITQLRMFGYLFNPVSFYYAYDQQNNPLCIVAEVANTFNEQKLYLLQSGKNGDFSDQQLKNFYISPFSDLQTSLHFHIRFPSEKLLIQINESDQQGIYFRSGIKGNKQPLTAVSLLYQSLRFPFATAQIMVGIHWHALCLFLKKIPVRKKSDHKEFQTDTREYLPKQNITSHQRAI